MAYRSNSILDKFNIKLVFIQLRLYLEMVTLHPWSPAYCLTAFITISK